MDAYATPAKPVEPLIPFLRGVRVFAEPCAGDGALIAHLEASGLSCGFSGDLADGFDALGITHEHVAGCDAIITNPPWTRAVMHPLIRAFMATGLPVWLLFDADWMHTKQAVPLLPHCSDIVTVRRVKWMEDSKHVGKDNAAWYRFAANYRAGPRFFAPETSYSLAVHQSREAANDNRASDEAVA